MAIPTFLSTSYDPYQYSELGPHTDVASIITDVRTLCVTNLSWTEPSSNLFKSPVDVDGRFMDVLLTRINATTLEFRLRNQSANVICTRRIQIAAAGNGVRYYMGKYHFVVESLDTTSELLQAFILEQSPDIQSSVSNCVIGNGYRDTSGTVDGLGITAGQFFAMDNGTAGYNTRLRGTIDSAGGARPLVTASGRLIYSEALIAINQGGAIIWSGRLPQALICDDSISFGSDKVVPIDDATTATFRVLGLTSANGTVRIMVRKAG